MARADVFNPKSKKFWLMLFLLALGIMLMLVGSCESNNVYSGTENTPGNQVADEVADLTVSNNSLMDRQERALADELRKGLEYITGGQVEVQVQLATSTHYDYAINTTTGQQITEETDQDGGSRQITDNNDSRDFVIKMGNQGLEEPVLEKEVAPEVTGVLVVAEGAEIPEVKNSLFQAVQVALGAEPQNIIVLPMQRGD